jgi:hypothetical protein
VSKKQCDLLAGAATDAPPVTEPLASAPSLPAMSSIASMAAQCSHSHHASAKGSDCACMQDQARRRTNRRKPCAPCCANLKPTGSDCNHESSLARKNFPRGKFFGSPSVLGLFSQPEGSASECHYH